MEGEVWGACSPCRKIWHSEISSEAMFGAKCFYSVLHVTKLPKMTVSQKYFSKLATENMIWKLDLATFLKAFTGMQILCMLAPPLFHTQVSCCMDNWEKASAKPLKSSEKTSSYSELWQNAARGYACVVRLQTTPPSKTGSGGSQNVRYDWVCSAEVHTILWAMHVRSLLH